jgi:hypothetical protein
MSDTEEQVKGGKKRKYNTKAIFGDTRKEDLPTPSALVEAIKKEFCAEGEELFDPCPLGGRAIAEKNPEEDGLLTNWKSVTFVNPPFSETEKWLVKAVCECSRGNTVIFLAVGRLNTNYWKDLIVPNAHEIRFFSGRMKFIVDSGGMPFPITLIVFKPGSARNYKSVGYGGTSYWTSK